MGQYYRPIILSKKNKPLSFAVCYDFASGAKLMEHSWLGNNFVGFVERQLLVEPRKLVWAGDYADEEPFESLTKEEIAQCVEDGYELDSIKKEGLNLYSLTYGVAQLTHGQQVEDKYKHDFKTALPKRYKYLVNYDKGEFVDKSKVPVTEVTEWEGKKNEWRIHPLPLLTCEGNGRGGGDFRGDGKNLLGRWSRDTIGVTSKKSDIPKDFKEINFDLKE